MPVLRLGIHPEMERFAILNRSMPCTSDAAMNNLALFQGCLPSAFQRLVKRSMRSANYCSVKSIPEGERFFQASKGLILSFSVNFYPSVQNRSILQLIYQLPRRHPVLPDDERVSAQYS